jgi:hypothetical protein
MMCPHTPRCPDASAADREAARTIAGRPEQGWSLLCNGVILFEDTGALLPGGAVIAPHRTTGPAASQAWYQQPGHCAPLPSRPLRPPAA